MFFSWWRPTVKAGTSKAARRKRARSSLGMARCQLGVEQLEARELLSGGLGTLINKGTGRFNLREPFYPGAVVIAVAVGDLTEDGKRDLAVVNAAGAATVLVNDGRADSGRRGRSRSGSGRRGLRLTT